MKLPRYPKYKDSGVEWLGGVPEHWKVTRLKRLATVMPSNVDKKVYDDEAAVRLCNYTDVYYNDAITDEMSFMEATASPEQIERFSLRQGDTIITKDSETPDDIARSSYVGKDMPGVVCGYHLAIVRPSADSVGEFLKWIFDANFTRAVVAVNANGLTRFGLSQHSLDNIPVVRPSREEQIQIAGFIAKANAQISALVKDQQRLIELLKEKRQAVISHAVTKGLNRKVPMKPSGIEWLGDVPAHWEAKRLGWLFRQTKRQNYPDQPVLSVYRDYGVILKESREDNFNRTPEDLSSYQLVVAGDLVVNKMKAWQGSLGISNLNGITSPDYVVFTPHHQEYSPFLHFLLRSQAVVPIYRTISNGIRVAQWRLEPEAFLSLRFFMPPETEQREICAAIASEAKRCEGLIAKATKAIELLQERRSALISAAVTGKIDVRGLTSTEAA